MRAIKKMMCLSMILLTVAVGCSPEVVVNQTTTPRVTGKVDNSKNYSGRDCIMVDGKLYWQESIGNYLPTNFKEDYKLIGTIKKLVDKIPEEDMTSAKTQEGTEIYTSDKYPGKIFRKWENPQKTEVLITYIINPLIKGN